MSQKKYYFLAPGLDFPVGSITLGSILQDPRCPHDTLFSPETGDIDTNSIRQTEKLGITLELIEESDKQVGLFARFLESLHIGLEANMRYASLKARSYSFKKLSTEWFEPSGTLLEKSTQSEDVLQYLTKTNFEEPVYMITGIKIAEGASVITTSLDGKSHRFSLGADMTASGFPLSIGPKAHREKQKIHNEAFEDSSPIIFAFRLKEIRCGPEIIAQDVRKGALFGAEEKKRKISVCSQSDEFKKEMLEEFDLEAHEAIDESGEGKCFAITTSELLE